MKPSLLLAFFLFGSTLFAQTDSEILLPKPQTEGGMPLMTALQNRKTVREISPELLSEQQLSNLLWAAWGQNRQDGRRTAPSARNMQEIDLYVLKADGAFRFDPTRHALIPIIKEDIRVLSAKAEFAQKAPVMILFVVNYDRQPMPGKSLKKRYAAVDAGFIGQNIYLYAASENLATVFLGQINPKEAGEKLKLTADQEVIYGQVIGKKAK